MKFRHDTEVKNFLDTVLRDYLAAHGASFGSAVPRRTFTAAYTQYVIKGMIAATREGGRSLDLDRLTDKLDMLNGRLRSPIMEQGSLPEEILDIDDAGGLEGFKAAIEFTKHRIAEHYGMAPARPGSSPGMSQP